MSSKRPRGEDEEGGGNDGGGDAISMSVEESNKLRISLGLKPLKIGGANDEEESARGRHMDAKRKKEQEARAQAFVAKKAENKRQVAQDKFVDTKSLGDADNDDDMQNWVERQRVSDVARKAEEAAARRTAAAESGRKRAAAAKAAAADSDDEGGGGGYTAADLAGLKVKHSADDLAEGETMVLTLADRKLLGERGQTLRDEEDDELENVLKAETGKRKKARDASAPKAKPLWEEDGKRRGLLDKYDEEEEEASMQLGVGGSLESMRARVQDDVRKKLAEGGKLLETAAVGIMFGDKPAPQGEGTGAGNSAADYYTESEVKGFKKSKKKKERKIRAKSAEAEELGTAALIEQLEAAADAGGGASDLGARGGRLTTRERTEVDLRASEKDKRERFEAAVEKGNWASHALRPAAAAAIAAARQALGSVGDEEDEDMELQESLARARRLALKSAGEEKGGKTTSVFDGLAASSAKAREEDELKLKEELAAGRGRGLGDHEVNDTMEFVRNIQVKPEMIAAHAQSAGGGMSVAGTNSRMPLPASAKIKEEGEDYMDLDGEEEGTHSRMPVSPAPDNATAAGWVSSAPSGMLEEGAASHKPKRQIRGRAGGDEGGVSSREEGDGPTEKSVIGEQALGKGLAATLAALQHNGNLLSTHQITWAGRVNDRSKNALQGLIGDVYSGGLHEDRLARSIEAALTTKDEFGRVQTPKERFRQLCYDFHGKRPSKNKETTRLQKAAEEISRRKNATSEVAEGQEMKGLKIATERVAQPYVVLQGKGAMESLKSMSTGAKGDHGKMLPPPSRKPGKGYAPIPPLGNLTPLLGDRKVEAMLGIKKQPHH